MSCPPEPNDAESGLGQRFQSPSNDASADLLDIANQISRKFEANRSLADAKDVSFSIRTLQDEAERFELWIVNSGLRNPGQGLLNRYLNMFPVSAPYVEGLLDNIMRDLNIVEASFDDQPTAEPENDKDCTIDRAANLASDSTDQDFDSDDEDFESYQDESMAKIALDNATQTIQSLYRLAFRARYSLSDADNSGTDSPSTNPTIVTPSESRPQSEMLGMLGILNTSPIMTGQANSLNLGTTPRPVGPYSRQSLGRGIGRSSIRSSRATPIPKTASSSRQIDSTAGLTTMRGLQPPHALPPETSFLFSIDEISPNYNVQLRSTVPSTGWWVPPTRWDAFTPPNNGIFTPTSKLWRWLDGQVRPIDDLQSYPHATELHSHESCKWYYSAATVFTLSPANQQYLGVNFDARRYNVSEKGQGKWIELGFEHLPHPRNPSDTPHPQLYSYLQCPGARPTLAARHPTTNNHWASQFFTSQYYWSPHEVDNPNTFNAGLIGKLPYLLAMVAFSSPKTWLSHALENLVRLRQWIPRPPNIPHGRTFERGVVVTVWIDPAPSDPRYGDLDDEEINRRRNIMEHLEKGNYGPFFAA